MILTNFVILATDVINLKNYMPSLVRKYETTCIVKNNFKIYVLKAWHFFLNFLSSCLLDALAQPTTAHVLLLHCLLWFFQYDFSGVLLFLSKKKKEFWVSYKTWISWILWNSQIWSQTTKFSDIHRFCANTIHYWSFWETW